MKAYPFHQMALTILAALALLGAGCRKAPERTVADFFGTWTGEGMKLRINSERGGHVEIQTPRHTLLLTGAWVEPSKEDGFIVSFVSPSRRWKATLSEDGKTLILVAKDDGEKVRLTREKEGKE